MQAVTQFPGVLPSVILSPIKAGSSVTGCTLEVLVRVQAPTKPPAVANEAATHRQPLRLALVVDRSGSMDGEPLTEAMRCVNHISERLQKTDQLAIVLYDDKVQCPVPLRYATSSAEVRATLGNVQSGGSTDLFAGWEAGVKQLEAGSKGSISRVILLSDGQVNMGLTDTPEIEKQCASWLAKGVSTTTVGLGHGFNEELMMGMAQAGGGKQYYGKTAEDLFDGFDEELALLESMCLRKLRIKLIPGAGVIVEPLGLVKQNADQTIALTDLAWEAESWVLVRLHISAISSNEFEKSVFEMGERALLTATLQAETMDGKVISASSPVLSLKNKGKADWQAMPVDDMVNQRLLEVQFGETGDQVRNLLLSGDMKAAYALLKTMEANAQEHPWLKDKVARLKALAQHDVAMASKELRYNRAKMSSRLSSSVDLQYSADETSSSTMPAYLRRKSSEGAGRRPTGSS